MAEIPLRLNRPIRVTAYNHGILVLDVTYFAMTAEQVKRLIDEGRLSLPQYDHYEISDVEDAIKSTGGSDSYTGSVGGSAGLATS